MQPSLKFSRRSFILASLALAACKNGTSVSEISGSTMGTSYSIAALDHSRALDMKMVKQAVEDSLSRVTTLMSNWDAKSEVSRFNTAANTAPVAISSELAKVVSAAQEVHVATEGQFDITLGPVIEAWGFGARGAHAQTPAPAALQQAMASVGTTSALTLNGTQLQKHNADTQIYLSSIGKGFGVDLVADTLKGFGLKDFMVEIGGDVYVSGLNADGDKWQIGIESPDALSRRAYEIASVSNMGMATSGDYRNYFEQDGLRYSHIIDAQTGRPITHQTASVTVLAENAMLADAWATGLLALGKERGLEIADKHDLAVMFIDRKETEGKTGFVAATSKRFAALQA